MPGAPVGFGPQRRSDNEARSFVRRRRGDGRCWRPGPQRRGDNEARSERRWGLVPGKQRERAGVIRSPVVPVGFGLQKRSDNASWGHPCAGGIGVAEAAELGSAFLAPGAGRCRHA